MQSHRLQKLNSVRLVETGDFRFDRRANGNHRRTFRCRELVQAIQVRVIFKPILGHIRHIHRGLDRHQAKRREHLFFFCAQAQTARRLGFIQMRQQLVVERNKLDCILIPGPGLLAVTMMRLFDGRQISQRQLGDDHFNIRQRVDTAGHVHDVFVFKTTHHVDDGVRLPNIGQELVTQSFTLAGARDQTGDVDELDDGRHHSLRLDDGGKLRHARIRHLDDADIGLDRAERIVLGRNARFGQRVEQGGLADIGQTDDAAFQTHAGVSLLNFGVAGRTHRQRQRFHAPHPAGRAREDLAALELNPPVEYYRLDNRIRTVAAGGERGIYLRRIPGSPDVRLWGTIPLRDRGQDLLVGIEDPAQYAAKALRQAWRARDRGGRRRRRAAPVSR